MLRNLRLHRLMVRTPGFHPGNRGSIPLGAANKRHQRKLVFFVLVGLVKVVVFRFCLTNRILKTFSCKIRHFNDKERIGVGIILLTMRSLVD
jgi:hypothetical protein